MANLGWNDRLGEPLKVTEGASVRCPPTPPSRLGERCTVTFFGGGWDVGCGARACPGKRFGRTLQNLEPNGPGNQPRRDWRIARWALLWNYHLRGGMNDVMRP